MQEGMAMGMYLSARELAQLESAEKALPSPVPTQIISNGEFNPLPQTPHQQQVEALTEKEKTDLYANKFANYVRQIFLNSDTSVALLSGAPFDDPSWWVLPNEQIREAVDMVNRIAGTWRMLGHAVVMPGQPGWMDAVDVAIDQLHPDSWKLYTIGDPRSPTSKYPFRLDDETLVYPFYEKTVNAGIRPICIHKGLMPADYEQSRARVWQYNTAWDIGKAAKDWPQLNFIIYHGCLQASRELPDRILAEFEKTGEIKWASDLAHIPAQYGVTNVYAEMGSSFANSCTANPASRRRSSGPGSKAWVLTIRCGGPTRCGTPRRSGSSRRCAAWRSRRTCRRSTALHRYRHDCGGRRRAHRVPRLTVQCQPRTDSRRSRPRAGSRRCTAIAAWCALGASCPTR
jgi:hypothetical protein